MPTFTDQFPARSAFAGSVQPGRDTVSSPSGRCGKDMPDSVLVFLSEPRVAGYQGWSSPRARHRYGAIGLAAFIGPGAGSSAVVQPPPSASTRATLATSRLCWIDSAVC
jgi:hypothetical protein